MTKIISFATTKGGTGKTTLVASLATYWKKEGKNIAVLDTDPNANLVRWFEKGKMSDIEINSETDESKIIDSVSQLEIGKDFVLIDIAGFANQAMIYAIGISSFVVIPARPAEDDVIEAIRTKQIVQNASKLTRRDILYKVVLTQVRPNTVVLNHSRTQFSAFNVPLFSTEIGSRTAFPNTRYQGTTPILSEPNSKAAKEITCLAQEIEQSLKE